MAGARFEFQDKAVRKRLKKFINRAGDMTPALKSFGEHMVNVTETRFKGEKAPSGAPWQPLKPATRRSKKKNKDKILTEYGRLRRSIIYRAKDQKMAYGTNKKYGAIHQFGGKAGRNRAADIPARPYLGINSDDQAEWYQILRDYLEEA